MLDLTKIEDRKKLLEMINPESNESEKKRIFESQFECDILEGKLLEYIMIALNEKFSKETIKEMPIVSSINLAKRINFQEACLYREAPTRSFSLIKEDSKEYLTLQNWYKAAKVNSKLNRANKYYKHSLQCALYILIVNGKPEARVLKKHEYFYIDGIYIIPNNTFVLPKMKDKDKKKAQRFTLWSEDFNFVMDGNGEFITKKKNIGNDLKIVPIIDIATDKDGNFWVTQKRGVSEFTVQLNIALSSLMHVMHMQGFAIGTISGALDMLNTITQQTIGVNKLLKLPITVDKDGNQVKAEASFISPSPDLSGSIAVIETLLSAFLTSEGIDPKSVSLKGESESYSSGWERLIALISKFDSSKEDIAVFEDVETECFKIIKAYINNYKDDSNKNLDDKYITQGIENVEVYIEYVRPEMIETKGEKEARLSEKEKRGQSSRVDTIMELNNCTRKEALEIIKQIHKDNKDIAEIIGMNEAKEENQEELIINNGVEDD